MTEATPRKIQLQVFSREQVVHEMGTIERAEIVFRGVPSTVYSPVNSLTKIGFESYVKDIASAEESAIDSWVVRNLAIEGKTPEQFIEEGSHRFIADLKANKFTASIEQHVLAPLVKQRAMRRLFDEAKRAQQPQGK